MAYPIAYLTMLKRIHVSMRPEITVPHSESSGFFILPLHLVKFFGTTGATILDQFKSCRNVE
jgi:hypothetical protein